MKSKDMKKSDLIGCYENLLEAQVRSKNYRHSIYIRTEKPLATKGQEISKAIFLKLYCPKSKRNFLKDFCPKKKYTHLIILSN